ncbi:MAG: hypothetical protein ACRD4P_13600 [Bryobacteraceae bacterium]
MTAHTVELENSWRDCPPQCTSEFASAFFQISRTIQAQVREILPARFFSMPNAYGEIRFAYPMLAYSCSRPSPPRYRTDFTYDTLNPSLMSSFFWSARQSILARIEETHRFLEAQGQSETAALYLPRRAFGILDYVRSHRRALDGILVAEGALVNELIHFADRLRRHRTRPGREAERVLRSWASILRRTYPSVDLSDCAFDLFVLATRALNEARHSREEDAWKAIPTQCDAACDISQAIPT